ncbi:MAG TPA: class I SAM-dependent methyltransferase [Chitinophagaceae bacterium]|jgi:SAM-dependent methyltransferase|nr:class I SAM-dependent methyltransferase [Chitinophagaceae bacterium]
MQHQSSNTYQANDYWSSIFNKQIDAKSVCYPDWPLSYNQFLHQQQIEMLLKILQSEHIQIAGKSVMEIGPGSGFWTHFFNANQVESYTGIDINEKVISHLQQQYPLYQFFHQDIGIKNNRINELPQVDIVFAAMVLLHITDDKKIEQAFTLINQQLKPKGIFILLDAIATHQVFGVMKQQAEGIDFDPQFHNKIRKMETVKILASKNNLEIVKVIPAFNTSQMCFDFKTYLGYLIWGKCFYAFHRRLLHHASENTGKKVAAFQRVLDRLLTQQCGMSMSSKWIVFRKKEG